MGPSKVRVTGFVPGDLFGSAKLDQCMAVGEPGRGRELRWRKRLVCES